MGDCVGSFLHVKVVDASGQSVIADSITCMTLAGASVAIPCDDSCATASASVPPAANTYTITVKAGTRTGTVQVSVLDSDMHDVPCCGPTLDKQVSVEVK